MPDGDKVHEGLPWRYQKIYMQICEGTFSLSSIAKDTAEAVWKDARVGGDSIIDMLSLVAQQLMDIQRRKMFEAIDWWQEVAHIDDVERTTYAQSRLKRLAYEACREWLQALHNNVYATNYNKALLQTYLENIYRAKLEERIPLKRTHLNGMSQEVMREQLEALRPLVGRDLSEYAEAIYKSGTVLSRKPRSKSKKPDYGINTDISVVGL